MSWNSKRTILPAVAGNLDGHVAGTREAMGQVEMSRVIPGTLAAELTVDCETSTMTMYAEWQVSRDGGSTWILCANGPQNAASVILATGTAGADAAVVRVFDAPDAVHAYPLARLTLRNEVAQGTTSDTYSCVYSYIRS
jgi:hypothetical protein